MPASGRRRREGGHDALRAVKHIVFDIIRFRRPDCAPHGQSNFVEFCPACTRLDHPPLQPPHQQSAHPVTSWRSPSSSAAPPRDQLEEPSATSARPGRTRGAPPGATSKESPAVGSGGLALSKFISAGSRGCPFGVGCRACLGASGRVTARTAKKFEPDPRVQRRKRQLGTRGRRFFGRCAEADAELHARCRLCCVHRRVSPSPCVLSCGRRAMASAGAPMSCRAWVELIDQHRGKGGAPIRHAPRDC